MDHQTRIALEELVEGIEQTFTILARATCETTDPARFLQALLEQEIKTGETHGPNGWRDRFARRMTCVAAQGVRLSPTATAAQKALAEVVLQPHDERSDPGKTN